MSDKTLSSRYDFMRPAFNIRKVDKALLPSYRLILTLANCNSSGSNVFMFPF